MKVGDRLSSTGCQSHPAEVGITLHDNVDREDAESLADRIDEFLREHDARTKRERHSATDVHVLATVD